MFVIDHKKAVAADKYAVYGISFRNQIRYKIPAA